MLFLRRNAPLVLLAGLVAAGCNRAPAEEALGEAERTLDGVRSHLAQYAPERLTGLERSLADARAALGQGRYTDALRVAQELPARIHAAVEVADRRELVARPASPAAHPVAADRGTPPVPGQ